MSRSEVGELDTNLICALMLDINDNIKRIGELVTDQRDYLLKELAAASIHISFFARDLTNLKVSQKDKEVENKFKERCGCKDEN